jgi:hypothetical protein
MPDLVTHYAVAHLIGRRWRRPAISLCLFGALLPDLLTRPFYILWPKTYWLVMPLHTPVGIFIASSLVALFFRLEDRRAVFIALMIGALLHFALDALQRHLVVGYFWLWPFSWWTTERGLFWSEESLVVMPWLAAGVGLLEGWGFAKKRLLSETT